MNFLKVFWFLEFLCKKKTYFLKSANQATKRRPAWTQKLLKQAFKLFAHLNGLWKNLQARKTEIFRSVCYQAKIRQLTKLAKHLQFLKQIFEIFCKASQSKLVDSWNDSICFDGSHWIGRCWGFEANYSSDEFEPIQ